MIELPPSELTSDQLVDEALLLSEQLKQPYLSEQRKDQIAQRLSHVIFEYKYQMGEYGTGTEAAS